MHGGGHDALKNSVKLALRVVLVIQTKLLHDTALRDFTARGEQSPANHELRPEAGVVWITHGICIARFL